MNDTMNDTTNPAQALADYRALVTDRFATYTSQPGETGRLAKEAATVAVRWREADLNYQHHSAKYFIRRYERLVEKLGVDPLA